MTSNGLHDRNNILTPGVMQFGNMPAICRQCGTHRAFYIAHVLPSHVWVKMLKIYADGNEHHYNDVLGTLFPDKGYGYDYELWLSLVNNKYIAFSSKHSHGSKYYKITPIGQEVLAAANANYAYFRIMRWFKLKGEDFYTNLMNADLNGEDSYNDLVPSSFISFLEQIFDTSSDMRRNGSAFRWMNNFINLLKTNDEFYEKATAPEVMSWAECHSSTNDEVKRYLDVLAKVAKRRMKKKLPNSL